MPLTAAGKKVMASLEKEYKSKEKAERIFYALINEGKLKRSEMEETAKSGFEEAFGDRLFRIDTSDWDKK